MPADIDNLDVLASVVEAVAALDTAVEGVRALLPRTVAPADIALYKDLAERVDAACVTPLRDFVTQLREGCADAIPVRRIIEDDGTERWESEPVESGGRVWRRTGKPTRSGFDKDRCRRDVLDSRLITERPAFDHVTGEVLTDEHGERGVVREVVEETPLDKILAVFPLGDPRVKALDARGLKIDDYCTTSWGARDVKEIEPEPAKETP